MPYFLWGHIVLHTPFSLGMMTYDAPKYLLMQIGSIVLVKLARNEPYAGLFWPWAMRWDYRDSTTDSPICCIDSISSMERVSSSLNQLVIYHEISWRVSWVSLTPYEEVCLAEYQHTPSTRLSSQQTWISMNVHQWEWPFRLGWGRTPTFILLSSICILAKVTGSIYTREISRNKIVPCFCQGHCFPRAWQ